MTIAHLIETILGKFGLIGGFEGDATPFTEVTVADITSRLHDVSDVNALIRMFMHAPHGVE